MTASKSWQLIILIVVLFYRPNYAKTSEKYVLQILMMEYEKNPYKWESQMLEYTATILNEHLVEAMNDHNIPSIQNLYNEAISKLYARIPARVLVEQLWKMQNGNDWKSFLNMVRAQLSLYWRYNLDKNRDYNYILMAANCFYKIKHDPLYVRLNDHTKDLLESAISSLPTSLQYLFGKKGFCLLNKMYSEMLYQCDSEQINSDTSYVYTWSLVKNFSDNLGLVMPIFVETPEDNLSDLNLALTGKHSNGYYYRLPEYGQIIGANLTQQVLKNYVWGIEFVNDDQLVFKQDDYLMCGFSSLGYEHGNVYALANKNIFDSDCQWSAGECDRR